MLASQTAEVGAALDQAKIEAEAVLNLWSEILTPWRFLSLLKRFPRVREVLIFYVVLCAWIILLGLSGRYHVGPFLIILSASMGLELWLFDAGFYHQFVLQKIIRTVVLGCFFYMTLFHFENVTLGNIYNRLGQLERSARRVE